MSRRRRTPKARKSLYEDSNYKRIESRFGITDLERFPATTRRQEKRNGNRESGKYNQPRDRPEMRAPGLFVPR